jgi:hypothetical protein
LSGPQGMSSSGTDLFFSAPIKGSVAGHRVILRPTAK